MKLSDEDELKVEMELVRRKHAKSVMGTVPLNPDHVRTIALANIRERELDSSPEPKTASNPSDSEIAGPRE